MGIAYKYFQIMADENNKLAPKLIHKTSISDKNIPKETSQIYVENAEAVHFSDFMDNPFLLVSDRFIKTVRLYNSDYISHAVVLTERAKQTQQVYWHIDLPNVDYFLDEDKPTSGNIASRKSAEFYKVDSAKVEGLSFFMFQWRPTTKATYIIRLDLAESLLRRDISGFSLKGLEHK